MRRDTPPPLTVAASLVALQGLVLIGFAVVEVATLNRGRLTLDVTTALFFAIYAALLLAGAWALQQQRSWPRGPVLVTQLIELLLAFDLRGTLPVAILMALVSAGVIAGMLHPATMEVLAREGGPGDGEDVDE